MRWALIDVLLGLLSLVCQTADGANFVAGQGCREEYIRAAEAARERIAVYWTGKPLPGEWSSPCEIHVREEGPEVGAGGATSFAFGDGEVYGWRMTVQGPQRLIRDSVVPHEVQHTVIASITRRPIPRWLDEGMATLFETEDERERSRTASQTYLDHRCNVFYRFDAMEYPSAGPNGSNIMALYSTGATFTEWLLQRGGKAKLWAFATDARLPSQKFEAHYGITPSVAMREWRVWCRNGCPVPRAAVQGPRLQPDAWGERYRRNPRQQPAPPPPPDPFSERIPDDGCGNCDDDTCTDCDGRFAAVTAELESLKAENARLRKGIEGLAGGADRLVASIAVNLRMIRSLQTVVAALPESTQYDGLRQEIALLRADLESLPESENCCEELREAIEELKGNVRQPITINLPDERITARLGDTVNLDFDGLAGLGDRLDALEKAQAKDHGKFKLPITFTFSDGVRIPALLGDTVNLDVPSRRAGNKGD